MGFLRSVESSRQRRVADEEGRHRRAQWDDECIDERLGGRTSSGRGSELAGGGTSMDPETSTLHTRTHAAGAARCCVGNPAEGSDEGVSSGRGTTPGGSCQSQHACAMRER